MQVTFPSCCLLCNGISNFNVFGHSGFWYNQWKIQFFNMPCIFSHISSGNYCKNSSFKFLCLLYFFHYHFDFSIVQYFNNFDWYLFPFRLCLMFAKCTDFAEHFKNVYKIYVLGHLLLVQNFAQYLMYLLYNDLILKCLFLI